MGVGDACLTSRWWEREEGRPSGRWILCVSSFLFSFSLSAHLWKKSRRKDRSGREGRKLGNDGKEGVGRCKVCVFDCLDVFGLVIMGGR